MLMAIFPGMLVHKLKKKKTINQSNPVKVTSQQGELTLQKSLCSGSILTGRMSRSFAFLGPVALCQAKFIL